MKTTKQLFVILCFQCTFILSAISPLMSQSSGYWRVFFKDKGNEVLAPGSNLWYKTMEIHNQRCLDRRKKTNPKAPLITQSDAPVNQGYINEVSKFVDTVLLTLRWNNYIVVKTDSSRLTSIKNLSFVKGIQRTGVKMFPVSRNLTKSTAFTSNNEHVSTILTPTDNCGVFRYGISYNQADLLQIPRIHQMGIIGTGALLSFLDSGFNWKNHLATKHSNVITEYDFIKKDSVTANQSDDVPSQDYHGTICFSTVSGFQQDSLIGISPFSSFILAKTEDIPTEQHLEEDNYAAAIEWTESLGTDVISTSLGYEGFNQPFEEDYAFSDFNGRTTITSKVVNEAVKRGVICVTAAGNEGPGDSTIITPSDADSVIAVAAMTPDGLSPATFSSRGPRADGMIKPDIAAQGMAVVCINPSDTISLTNANGTSLATPLIGGAMSLFVSAFPEKTGYEIRNSLFRTALNAQSKNTVLGYGLAKVHDAMIESGILLSPMITYPIGDYQRIVFLAQSANPILSMQIHVRKKGANTFQSIEAFRHDTLHAWAIDMLKDTMGTDKYEAYVFATDSKRQRIYPPRIPNRDTLFTFSINDSIIPCGIPGNVLPKHLYPMSITESKGKDGLMIDQTGEYRYQLYSLQGKVIKDGIMDLTAGLYTDSALQKLFGNTSVVALLLWNKNDVLQSIILSPNF